MKKILFAILLLSGCHAESRVSAKISQQQDRREACLNVMLDFCLHNERCTGQPYEDCFIQIKSEQLCSKQILSTVEDIKLCQEELKTSSCTDAPMSCMTLE